MNDRLRDAIDLFEAKLENGELIDYTDDVELRLVLNAAWRYWDLQDEEYEGY